MGWSGKEILCLAAAWHVGGAAVQGCVGCAVTGARAPIGFRRASCIGPSPCGGLPACADIAKHVEKSLCGRRCYVRRAIGARRRVGGSAMPTVARQSHSFGVASPPGGRAAGAACGVDSRTRAAVRCLSCAARSDGAGGEARAPHERGHLRRCWRAPQGCAIHRAHACLICLDRGASLETAHAPDDTPEAFYNEPSCRRRGGGYLMGEFAGVPGVRLGRGRRGREGVAGD